MVSTSELIRWALALAAVIFFALQLRMFVSQTDCAERIEKALEREVHWAQMAKMLKENVTASQAEVQSLREQLQEARSSTNQAQANTLLQKLAEVEKFKKLVDEQSEQKPKSHDSDGVLPFNNTKSTKDSVSQHMRTREEVLKAKARMMQEGNLIPGLRSLPPRLKRRLNPSEQQQQQKQLKNNGQVGDSPSVDNSVVAAVVIMACNRGDYLERTLKSVLKYHNPLTGKFPLFISQDGNNEEVKAKAKIFPQFLYVQHIEEAPPTMDRSGEKIAYYRIAEHYKWALTQLFDVISFPRVIILEDDMEISPDFFDYFEGAADLLDTDESVLAVSSWNDNGQKQFVHDAESLYRSDFFPGLGWMLTKVLWNELKPKWPKAYWDDWLRLEKNRKGRQSIRPEICRTYNFGEQGSSGGQFFNEYLASIRLNDKPVEWTKKDWSYLLDVNYPDYFMEGLRAAVKESRVEDVTAGELSHDVVLEYRDEMDFRRIASQFGIFQEWKDGVPRTAYEGVVIFRFRGPHRVFLATPEGLQRLLKNSGHSSRKSL